MKTSRKRDWILPPPTLTPLQAIGHATAREFGIPPSDLFGQCRTQEIAHARQVAYLIARDMTDASFPAIGRAFGGRDHTTILTGVRAVESRMTQHLRSRIDRIKAQLSMTIGDDE